ncbi:MAG TPA: response regulator transcription factor [Pseudobacteroides sp.]|uniref:response regulator transcription factor n=1 Tax=Pseudobacteroides sp. TaxID=1968840 RepID=UPI002F9497DB
MHKILIVDDDELIANLIEQNLKLEGFDTKVCHDGVSALEICDGYKPDLVVLDVMMPRLDGFHVCKCLQGTGTAVIMLTAKSDISDKLVGLEMGADDYIIKPFDSRELVARIKAVIRRFEKVSIQHIGNEKSSGNKIISLNEQTRIALAAGKELDLTPTEFELLLIFANNVQRVFTREQLLDTVWGYDYLGDSRTVDIHIQRLRKKLGKYSGCIETVFGIGYRYKEPIK